MASSIPPTKSTPPARPTSQRPMPTPAKPVFKDFAAI